MNKYYIAKRQYVKYALVVLLNALIGFYALVIGFSTGEEEVNLALTDIQALIAIGVGLLILILGLVVTWIIMRKKRFYEQDGQFIIEKGWLFKTVTKVPYDKINTIGLKRNLFDLVLKTTQVQVDTGAVMNLKAEINLVLDKAYATQLKFYLENKKIDESLNFPIPNQSKEIVTESKNVFYQATFRQLFMMGITKTTVLMTVFSLVLLLCFVTVIIQDAENPYVGNMPLVLWVYMMFGVLVIMTVLLMGLAAVLSYYKYRVILTDSHLEYSYGLLNKKTFKVNKSKIDAVYIKQPFLYRLLKRYMVEASIVGIGELNNDNSESESKYLLPFANQKQVAALLTRLEINMPDEKRMVRPQKLKKFNFIILPVILLTIVFIPAPIVLSTYIKDNVLILVVYILIYIGLVIGCMMRMKIHGYYIADKRFVVAKGSYDKSIGITKLSRIQKVTYQQGPILQIEKLGKIVLYYRGFARNLVIKAYDETTFDHIKKEIIK